MKFFGLMQEHNDDLARIIVRVTSLRLLWVVAQD